MSCALPKFCPVVAAQKCALDMRVYMVNNKMCVCVWGAGGLWFMTCGKCQQQKRKQKYWGKPNWQSSKQVGALMEIRYRKETWLLQFLLLVFKTSQQNTATPIYNNVDMSSKPHCYNQLLLKLYYITLLKIVTVTGFFIVITSTLL